MKVLTDGQIKCLIDCIDGLRKLGEHTGPEIGARIFYLCDQSRTILYQADTVEIEATA